MVYTFCEDYRPEVTHEFIKYRGRKKGAICERWISLDTETSHNHEKENPIGWIYQWSFIFGNDCVFGRTPSQLMRVLRRIVDAYSLGPEKRIAVYIHNASYDLQYLKDYLYKEFGEFRVLALKERHIITYDNDFFSFRCSYRLSNKSLEKWAKDLGCKNQKKVGLVDYDIIRYQDSELSEEDWAYMFGDVLTLDECMERQLALYDDNISTIPYTATGYIRRVTRQNFQKVPHNWRAFQNSRLNATTYAFCKREYSGGLTHGNRFLAGEIVRPGAGQMIRHRDFRSHYPSQQRTQKFPIGMFNLWGRDVSIETINKLMDKYSLLIECQFSNIVVKDASIVFPILQESKCKVGKIGPVKMICDNGRVLSLRGTVSLVCTEYDLYWILRMYDIQKIKYTRVYAAVKDYLPEFMRETIDGFFLGKTEFKEKEKAETDPEKKLDFALSLMKAKNGLNSVYGMTSTDPVRLEITMDPEGLEPWHATQPKTDGEALDAYYNNRNNFMRFSWGCWCTSLARSELLKFAYDIIGNKGAEMWRCIYMDTDSIFYISDAETERRIETYNAELLAESERLGAFIEYNGKRVHYNQFTDENENITEFKFLHAKTYGYRLDSGEMKVTIAGVPARVLDRLDENGKAVYYTREEELGSLENLEAGFIFRRCGGVAVTYTETGIYTATVNGHTLECGSAAIISRVTKTLSSEIEAHLEVLEMGIIGE